jgi:hypothetical protein
MGLAGRASVGRINRKAHQVTANVPTWLAELTMQELADLAHNEWESGYRRRAAEREWNRRRDYVMGLLTRPKLRMWNPDDDL